MSGIGNQLLFDEEFIDPIDIEIADEEMEISKNTEKIINLMKEIKVEGNEIRFLVEENNENLWNCIDNFDIAYNIFNLCTPNYNNDLRNFLARKKETSGYGYTKIEYDETSLNELIENIKTFFRDAKHKQTSYKNIQKSLKEFKFKDSTKKLSLTNIEKFEKVAIKLIESILLKKYPNAENSQKVSINEITDINPYIKKINEIMNDIKKISFIDTSIRMKHDDTNINVFYLLNPERYNDINLVCFFILIRINALLIYESIKQEQKEKKEIERRQQIINFVSQEEEIEKKESDEKENLYNWIVSVKKYLNNDNVIKCLSKNADLKNSIDQKLLKLEDVTQYDPIIISKDYPSILHKSKYDEKFFPHVIKIYDNQINIMKKLLDGFNNNGCLISYTSAPGEGKTTSIVGISKIINDMNSQIIQQNKRKGINNKEFLLLFACNSKLVRTEVFKLLHKAFGINLVDTKIQNKQEIEKEKDGLQRKIEEKKQKNENVCNLENKLRNLRPFAFERPRNIAEKQRVTTGYSRENRAQWEIVSRKDMIQRDIIERTNKIIEKDNYYIFEETNQPPRTIICDALSAHYIINDLKNKYEIVLFFDEPMIGADNFGSKSLAINAQLISSMPRYTILSSATLPNNINQIKNSYLQTYKKYNLTASNNISEVLNNNIRIGMSLKKYDQDFYHLFYNITTKDELESLINLIDQNPLFKKMCTLNSLKKLVSLIHNNTIYLNYEMFIANPNNWIPRLISEKVKEFLIYIRDNFIDNNNRIINNLFDFDITMLNQQNEIKKENILNKWSKNMDGMTLITTNNPTEYFNDFYNEISRYYNLEKTISYYDNKLDELNNEKERLYKKGWDNLSTNEKNKIRSINNDKQEIFNKMYEDFPNTYRINSEEYLDRLHKKSSKLKPKNNFFNLSIYYSLVKEILNDDNDGTYYKLIILALCGIGVYSKNLNTNYNKLLNSLAKSENLVFIVADDSVIFGVNYSFVRVIIDEDFSNYHSIEALCQVMGRAGRVGLSSSAEIFIPNILCYRLNRFIVRGKDWAFNEEQNLNMELERSKYNNFLNDQKDNIFDDACELELKLKTQNFNEQDEMFKNISENIKIRSKVFDNLIKTLNNYIKDINDRILNANNVTTQWQKELQDLQIMENVNNKKRKFLELQLVFGELISKDLRNKNLKLKKLIQDQIQIFHEEELELLNLGILLLKNGRKNSENEELKVIVIKKILSDYKMNKILDLELEFNNLESKIAEEREKQYELTQKKEIEKREFEQKRLELEEKKKEELKKIVMQEANNKKEKKLQELKEYIEKKEREILNLSFANKKLKPILEEELIILRNNQIEITQMSLMEFLKREREEEERLARVNADKRKIEEEALTRAKKQAAEENEKRRIAENSFKERRWSELRNEQAQNNMQRYSQQLPQRESNNSIEYIRRKIEELENKEPKSWAEGKELQKLKNKLKEMEGGKGNISYKERVIKYLSKINKS